MVGCCRDSEGFGGCGLTKKLFLSAGEGFLGRAVISHTLAAGFHVVGGSRRLAGVLDRQRSLVSVDYLSKALTNSMLEKLAPDMIIHNAATTSVDLCEADPYLAMKNNVRVTQNICEIAKALAIPVLFISTDQVFDGSKDWYHSTDVVCPINVYGATKALGEEYCLEQSSSNAIIRCNFFGLDRFSPNNFCGRIRSACPSEPVEVNGDIYFNPISIDVLVNRLHSIFVSGPSERIYQFGARERISKFELACKIADRLGVSRQALKAVDRDHFSLGSGGEHRVARRPRSMALIDNFYSSKIETLSIDQQISELVI